MSLWLQAVTEALYNGRYEDLRCELLPVAPLPMPECLCLELEFAERCCRDTTTDRLFPIRFLWLLEANEQRLFGYPAMGRSRFHPEKLLAFWKRVASDPNIPAAI